MKEFVLTSKENSIGKIVLNDPQRLNPLSQTMAWELLEAIVEMGQDSDVSVIIIRGAGGNFSAGGDLAGMKKRCDRLHSGQKPDSEGPENLRRLNKIVLAIRQVPKPVIAHIEGNVAGGGAAIVMACDFSIASEKAKMVFSFPGVALAPDMGSSVLLTRRVGVARATELFMLGKRFTAIDAAKWGIITHAYPPEKLDEEIEALADKLSKGPSLSYAATKAALNRTLYYGLKKEMENEISTYSNLRLTKDHAEAVDAFLEKRPAEFVGK